MDRERGGALAACIVRPTGNLPSGAAASFALTHFRREDRSVQRVSRPPAREGAFSAWRGPWLFFRPSPKPPPNPNPLMIQLPGNNASPTCTKESSWHPHRRAERGRQIAQTGLSIESGFQPLVRAGPGATAVGLICSMAESGFLRDRLEARFVAHAIEKRRDLELETNCVLFIPTSFQPVQGSICFAEAKIDDHGCGR